MNQRWNKIYERNKQTDLIYASKYCEDEKMFRENAIELLVELGEFVNETKCFKYWSVKEPIKEKVLDEYADCILMTLYFYNKLNMEIEISDKEENIDILDLINETFNLTTKIMNNISEELMKKIFNNLINIGRLLNYNEDEILDYIELKEKIVLERLNTENY